MRATRRGQGAVLSAFEDIVRLLTIEGFRALHEWQGFGLDHGDARARSDAGGKRRREGH